VHQVGFIYKTLLAYLDSGITVHTGKHCILPVSVFILYIVIILVAHVCGKRLLEFEKNTLSY
jgi:hypothetical protein